MKTLVWAVLGHLPGVFPWIQAQSWAEAMETHVQISPSPEVEPKSTLSQRKCKLI